MPASQPSQPTNQPDQPANQLSPPPNRSANQLQPNNQPAPTTTNHTTRHRITIPLSQPLHSAKKNPDTALRKRYPGSTIQTTPTKNSIGLRFFLLQIHKSSFGVLPNIIPDLPIKLFHLLQLIGERIQIKSAKRIHRTVHRVEPMVYHLNP